ncbi:MAG: cobaltochelatase subunit CobT, partial [Pseudomonadota bacterium]
MTPSAQPKGDSEDSSGPETFKRATAAALRAVGGAQDLGVSYGAEPTGVDGGVAHLPAPSAALPPEERGRLRGEADGLALKLRHHDVDAHAALAPGTPAARSVFDAMEQARVEALGCAEMAGVAANLHAAALDRCRRKGYARIVERERAPIADVIGFLTLEALTGAAPPEPARGMIDLWRPWVRAKIGDELETLRARRGDQAAFAAQARKLLTELGVDAPMEPEKTEAEQDVDDDADDAADSQEAPESTVGEESPDLAAAGDYESDDVDPGDVENMDDADGAEPTGEAPDIGEEPGRPGRRPPDALDMRDGAYAAFTEAHDETIAADALCDADELAKLRRMLDQQLSALQGVIGRLANRLQRRLMAQQRRSWLFDQEDGALDA